MEFVTIKVRFKNTPEILRFCSKCGREAVYQSSSKFRVNANGKNLDIWLVYNCTTCDNTFKRQLYSRVNCQSLEKEILAGFSENRACLAEKYAFDVEGLKHAGIACIIPEYVVESQACLPKLEGSFKVEIFTEFPLRIKLTSVLKKAFELSSRQMKRLVETETIFIEDGRNPQKAWLLQKQIATVVL